MMPNATDLVHSLGESSAGSPADSTGRFEAYQALVSLGAAALPALREGLRNEDWQVRRWCAICLDQVADADALRDLVPLLRDPKSKVRLWAVHALACDHCKDDVRCPVDVVPLLIERIETDDSIRVRRMAVIMLTTDFADARAVPVLERILGNESDKKLLLHAEGGLQRLREAGMA
jgi:HEAT repeat protein